MNKAFIIGNLTKDPELRTTGSGISVCNFTVAVQRRQKDKEPTADFIPVIAWRGLGENAAKYLQKGKKAAVVGEIQTRSYTAGDGGKRYITEILASDIEFLSSSKQADENGFDYTDEELPFS